MYAGQICSRLAMEVSICCICVSLSTCGNTQRVLTESSSTNLDTFAFLLGPQKKLARTSMALASQHSEMLKALMTGNWRESRFRVAALEDVEPQVFAMFKQFAEHGFYNLSPPPNSQFKCHCQGCGLFDVSRDPKLRIQACKFTEFGFFCSQECSDLIDERTFQSESDHLPGWADAYCIDCGQDIVHITQAENWRCYQCWKAFELDKAIRDYLIEETTDPNTQLPSGQLRKLFWRVG